MTRIEITSFQGGLANDKNVGQEGVFWNSKNIEFRRNSAYVELAKGSLPSGFTLPSGVGVPSVITLWGNHGTISGDVLVMSSNGKMVDRNNGVRYTLTTGGTIVNVAEANGKKYLIGQSHLHEFISPTSVTEGVATFANSTVTRPVLNFYGDLIIGDGTQVLRCNESGALVEYTPGTSLAVIGGLEGNVVAITQVGANIYVWCSDLSNTILYIWDGVSSSPSQKLKYVDTPVRNVAILGNKHYWWSQKGDYTPKAIMVGESYTPQLYIRSAYPDFPLDTQKDADNNRMALHDSGYGYVNDIETVNDIVLLPGVGSIYGFGRLFPGQPFALSREYMLPDGATTVFAILAGARTLHGIDATGFIFYAYQNAIGGSTPYSVGLMNLGQKGSSETIWYALEGEIETMEFIAPSFAEGEQNKKLLVPYELPSANTSIKVHVKRDRGSYEEVKTISSADGIGYHVAEISYSGKWRTIQFKFELISTSTTETPKLYTNITNLSETCGNKS